MARANTQRIQVSRQNVMLDKLCFEVLETDAGGVVEASLGLNHGLAAALRRSQHRLELHQILEMPEPDTSPKTFEQVKLWD